MSTPGKPSKLVVDVPTLVRIAVILFIEKMEAHRLLTAQPFGPELQKAVKHAVETPNP